jgi:hypothetical protein
VNDPRVMAHEGESARARHGIAGSQCHNGKAKRKENRWNPEKKQERCAEKSSAL